MDALDTTCTSTIKGCCFDLFSLRGNVAVGKEVIEFLPLAVRGRLA